ncbi:clostri-philic family protein [Clostridium cellulovorans]|uniref:Uncharacterized protein n=1 Tax=Clostridium cellulovorans (strain ATCC 35296 / DSM 3052 / OCM 3 / 743B) TaxID=573061 RepID=D9SM99_CLOC7|nr:clostri-philic family protein [Clostridium cellulovorans]ADL53755.1 hypothetical protein Clocel_4093 [Clostridium cellulovorans 743B]
MKKQHDTIDSMQKGQRRQKLHEAQDNHGTRKNPPAYENFEGNDIEVKIEKRK